MIHGWVWIIMFRYTHTHKNIIHTKPYSKNYNILRGMNLVFNSGVILPAARTVVKVFSRPESLVAWRNSSIKLILHGSSVVAGKLPREAWRMFPKVFVIITEFGKSHGNFAHSRDEGSYRFHQNIKAAGFSFFGTRKWYQFCGFHAPLEVQLTSH